MRSTTILVSLLAAFLALSAMASGKEAPKAQVVAYVFPGGSPLSNQSIDPHLVTRINYAFVTIDHGQLKVNPDTTVADLAYLTSLRQDHPSLTILISVGGWLGSGGFSEAASTPASRARLIASVEAFVEKFSLDGVDLDWEYPGLPGAGHAFSKEDKHNFTALIVELRAALKRHAQKSGRRQYLTIAAGASRAFLAHTEMAKVAPYLDGVNLMTYDYYEPGSGPKTGNHAPLYVDPADPEQNSASGSVADFIHAGVPASKILLGVPFYGHSWADASSTNHGLFQTAKPGAQTSIPFRQIRSSMLGQGFVRYWDTASRVPYLYNAANHEFVSYEDPESLTEKCKFVKAHGLGGVMFWSYTDDLGGPLLPTLNKELR